MINLLKSINWKRVGAIVVPMLGAWEVLPEDQKYRPRVLIPLAISGLAGLGINAEKYVAKRRTPANPFSTVDAQAKVERLK